MANDIDIKIRIDDGGAVTVLDNVGNALKRTETNAKTADEGFSKFERKIIALSQGFSLVQQAADMAGGAIGKALDFVQRGSAVQDVAEAFGNLANKAGALSGVLLNDLNRATAGTISNFDLMKQANESLRAGLKPDEILTLTKAARALAEETGGNLKTEIDEMSRAMLTGRDAALKLRGVYVDTETAELKYAAAMGTTRDKLTEVQRLEASRAEILAALSRKVKESGEIAVDAGDQVDQLNKEWNDLSDTLSTKAASAFDLLARRIKGGIVQEMRLLSSEFVRLKELVTVIGRGQNPFNSANYDRLDAEAQEDRVREASQNQLKEKLKIIEAEKKARAEQERILKIAQDRERLLVREKALKEEIVQQDKEARIADAAEIYGPGNAEGMREWFEETIEAQDDMADAAKRAAGDSARAWQDFYMQIGNAASNAIVQWRTANNDVAAENANIGQTVGGLIGTGIGLSVGGPAGGAVGASIGSMLGGVIGSLFGGKDSPGTAARKQADKFFADVFDANRLAVVINGELIKIEDLVFKGSTLFGGQSDFADGSFATFFQSLPAQARESFAGVGTAFEEMLGTIDDAGGQLAAVFANNIGGSINNLQLLIQATGKSAEELKSAIVEAMLDGKISFLEAQSALTGIERAFEKGIPDAIGATDQAWTNFMAAGAKGGRVTIDALQDMAHEAKEVGLDFDGLIARLKEQFPEAAEQIDLVFGVLREQGIDTIQELADASETALIPALAQIEATEFPWAESIKDINELIDKVNQIPKEVESNITFNVRTNMDSDTRALVDAGYIQGEGIPAGQ